MERVVRLYQLWSWLPHFRAIAETEHLPTASEALGLSPSALSRALKQLEASVGRELFIREGRSIRLNQYGTLLLRAVRIAMRGIDDALTSLDEEAAPVLLRVAAPGPFHSALMLDITEAAVREYPRLQVALTSCPSEKIASSLCRGTIDLCVHEEVLEHDELVSLGLATVEKVVACSASHPLANRQRIAKNELGQYAFAAPPENAMGLREDGWPSGVPRQVSLTVSQMQTGIDACLTGRHLVVLPRLIAEAHGLSKVHIDEIELPSVNLFATTRIRTELQPPEIDVFLELLQAAFRAHEATIA